MKRSRISKGCRPRVEYGYGTYTIKAVKNSGTATREYVSIAWY